VCLTPGQDAFIDKLLKAGECRNASDAIRDGEPGDTSKCRACRARQA
jgi:hypothetical protein